MGRLFVSFLVSFRFHENIRHMLIGVLGFLVFIGLFMPTGLSFQASSLFLPFFICFLCCLLGAWYRCYRHEEKIAIMLISCGHLVLFGALSAVLNYYFIALDRPFIDEYLVQLDAIIGFDWPEAAAIMQSYAFLDHVLTFAYATSLPQVALLIPLLALKNKIDDLERFLLIFMILIIVTIFFWAVFPSFGAAAYYAEIGYIKDFSGLAVNNEYIGAMLALKESALESVALSDIKGVVAFPSFHTVMSILCIYAAWGLRYFFWPFFILNILVIMSVPVDGGHHMMDVFAGALLAYVGIKIGEYFIPRKEKEALLYTSDLSLG